MYFLLNSAIPQPLSKRSKDRKKKKLKNAIQVGTTSKDDIQPTVINESQDDGAIEKVIGMI